MAGAVEQAYYKSRREDYLGLGKAEAVVIYDGCPETGRKTCAGCDRPLDLCYAENPRLGKGGRRRKNA